MELTRQGAFSLLLGFVSIALAVQLLFVAAGIEKYVFFCISVYYQVAALLTGMFRTCFMIFLLLKLQAIRISDKTGWLEKFSIFLTVISFILIFAHVATLKGGLIARLGGLICFQQSNVWLSGLLIALDFLNGVLCLYEFNRRLKEASKHCVNSSSRIWKQLKQPQWEPYLGEDYKRFKECRWRSDSVLSWKLHFRFCWCTHFQE
jgi:hypothetical protein